VIGEIPVFYFDAVWSQQGNIKEQHLPDERAKNHKQRIRLAADKQMIFAADYEL
jgi:hypothetical protein